ncbi:MAG: ATP-grasp domain-containing protein [Lachnospirales bacterium]
MKSIGIFGGGQLAKMIMVEGYKMGHTFNVYDSNISACSKPMANEFFNYSFTDQLKIDSFFNRSDVFTYEFENVDPTFLENYKNKIPQGVEALKLLQDRYTEKKFINNLPGVKTVKFCLASENINIFPCIIKTRRNGYDGKGQHFFESKSYLNNNLLNNNNIVEEYMEGIEEYSLIIGRNLKGEIKSYPPIKNIHKNGILYESSFTKNIGDNIKSQMKHKAENIIDALNYNGVLCVEYFVRGNDIFVNEIAPRVHNSGHLTIEATNISQFKLHLYCILGLNIPDIECHYDYYMNNILGQNLKACEYMMQSEEFKNINYHIYGKNSDAINRKVGHITYKNINNIHEKVNNQLANFKSEGI